MAKMANTAKPQAVILAAGESKRTAPLTLTRPKPLIKIANKTILEHNLDQLLGLVDEVILIVGYKKEMITDYLTEHFGDSYKGMKIAYVEQKEQLGTAHAVMSAKSRVHRRFLVMNGDDLYSREDMKAMLQNKYAVLGKKVQDPSKYGACVVRARFFTNIF